MKRSKRPFWITLLVSALGLGGCVTGEVSPEYPSKANLSLSRIEQRELGQADPEQHDRLLRLWADSPKHVAWLNMEKHGITKLPRIVSMSQPKYPLMPYLHRSRARVLMSIAIDAKGTVEAVRVFESSNERFDDAALDAVRRWRFLPAETVDGPTMSMLLLPMNFEPKKEKK